MTTQVSNENFRDYDDRDDYWVFDDWCCRNKYSDSEYAREHQRYEDECARDDRFYLEASSSVYGGSLDNKATLSTKMGYYLLIMAGRDTWEHVDNLTNLYQEHFGDRERYSPFEVAKHLFHEILPGYDADLMSGTTPKGETLTEDVGILIRAIFRNMPCLSGFTDSVHAYLLQNKQYEAYFKAVAGETLQVDNFGRPSVVPK